MDGGQTRTNISGWTTDTLHSHIQSMLNERDRYWLELLNQHDKRYEQRFKSFERAVEVAEKNAEKWRDNANEWRATMNDKDKTYMTKASAWGFVIGTIGFISALMTILFYFTRMTGKS